ncbi:hypothetical protein BDP55DRAFT_666674 [Colletotrichum godetiae]|uniref:Uncharacterized protein n=1 Tax=Colletotrichum godetiae TaxID=1209918 RepID=A0AAJ0AIF8_9PEZI|nr:uncharacterized protein BDP55DRAFT_666674 [Colletotrichum godetiae]KAK1674502.1 hypothetical protein BDP55DRAFT_666674 [Colletotrichum godetiae]
MPVPEGVVTPKLRCEKPGCELTNFTTRSNLKRHTRSKHGTSIPMSCGRTLQNHTSNIKRHQKSCEKSCAALESSPSDGQVGSESPTNATTGATEAPDFDFNHGFYSDDFGELEFLNEDFTFGEDQPEYRP